MLCPICGKEMKTSDDINFECSCGVTISEYKEVTKYDKKSNKRIKCKPYGNKGKIRLKSVDNILQRW